MDYLRKEGSLSKVVSEGDREAQKAVLQYQMRQLSGDAASEKYSCLDIQIDTGRFHQIRCQLSHAGMPILGDRKYGTEESLEESRRLGIGQTALCACEIRLQHPVTGQEIYREITPSWKK